MVQPLHSKALRIAAPALSFLAVLLASPALARASTTIAGGNLGDQTWTPAGSPYILQGDAVLAAGNTLTIQPGTEIQFASTDAQITGLDPTRVELTIKGTLNAVGTAAKGARRSEVLYPASALAAMLRQVDVNRARW